MRIKQLCRIERKRRVPSDGCNALRNEAKQKKCTRAERAFRVERTFVATPVATTIRGERAERGTEEKRAERGTEEKRAERGTEEERAERGTEEERAERGTEEVGAKRGTEEAGAERGTKEAGAERGMGSIGDGFGGVNTISGEAEEKNTNGHVRNML
ncbi:hypothetical protein NDU88_003984 [Pleurodeles waltl]|uniref:Uncharacterized protein n=1 Tax=Pleurodeles waltl TaxID=8319 RepID=A0AAV7REP2_PLEWA|nr:hypothetical protein NDU88_003984 [Pleurodeles waltl]